MMGLGNLPWPAHGMKLDWNLGALADGLRCYRSQEFFSAHEHWESVWLKCQEPEKSFLQALIQIAAAFHHLQRNNSLGAASLLKGALRRLKPYPTLFESVGVTPLREEVEAWLQVLEAHDSPIHPPFPQIRLVRPNERGCKSGGERE
jgi:predicted metal-dependent hydrolase